MPADTNSEADGRPAAPDLSFAQIAPVLRELPAANQGAASAAATLAAQAKTDPADAGLAAWLASWQGRHPIRLGRPRIALFAAVDGAAPGGAAAETETVRGTIDALYGATSPAYALAEAADCDLRVYELAIEQPLPDFRMEPALSEAEAAGLMAYGMMAVEEGVDLLSLGSASPGSAVAAAAIGQALFGGKPKDWHPLLPAGRLPAMPDDPKADALPLLARIGGRDIAAMAGALLAARMARVPVLLDGPAALAAAAILNAARPGAADHARWAQADGDPLSNRLAAAIGQERPAIEGLAPAPGAGEAKAITEIRARLAGHLDG